MGGRAQVIAAAAAAIGPHSLAGCTGKCLEGLRCGWSAPFNRILGPLCVKAALVARGLRLGDPVLQQFGTWYDEVVA